MLLSFPSVKDQPDVEGRTALMWAAQRGNYNVLKAMLEREVDIHVTDKLGATGTASSSQAALGHRGVLRIFVQKTKYLNHVPL